MASDINIRLLRDLGQKLEGELHTEESMRTIYATDASAYREFPIGVCIPKTTDDLRQIISFAAENKIPIIPRAAGTSLAGQVVGNGLVVDIGRHLNKILEINTEERWVRVEPGVIRDELNMYLKEYGFLFGPETSTANRAMIGGMIGNNSCGSNSVVYGSTRDHLLEAKVILSDGSETTFKSLSPEEFKAKAEGKDAVSDLEKNLYTQIYRDLSQKDICDEIDREFPRKEIPRRNTGYAVDLLKDSSIYNEENPDFNFCKLIAGSEGTLAVLTEAKLKIELLPPPVTGLLAVHFDSIYDSLLGNLEALKFNPSASELMDDYILECTKGNITQRENRFFIKGDPKAILVIELKRDTEEELDRDAKELTEVLKSKKLGYHYPLVTGPDTGKVWNLRKAGLGLLSNLPGDEKPVPVIEDTAVTVQDLPEYIKEFNELLKGYGLFSVHYAHAGSGELHLRPILDLKTEEGNRMFKQIALDIADLVKKYKGSLSGEHGDGRLRGEFIPRMIGNKNFDLIKRIKETWDPDHIFNPGKIVDTPEMNQQLRYFPGQETREFDTILRFDKTLGYQRAVELCNGSGDCRKTELTGGTMCPSYMATRDEKDTTRARANMLRETLSFEDPSKVFKNPDVVDILDLCLSCKGCTSECPSNVDMARLKTEYLTQYHQQNGASLRTRLMARFTSSYKRGSSFPFIFNFFIRSAITAPFVKSFLGVASRRRLPKLSPRTTYRWYRANKRRNFRMEVPANKLGPVYIFLDEFTNYTDAFIGKTVIRLFTRLGYDPRIIPHKESGRTQISKGFLNKAKPHASKNVKIFSEIVTEEAPLVGIEPSAILSFRDEYPDLVPEELKDKALELAKHCMTFEEFIAREIKNGKIQSSQFKSYPATIKIHGHCHQKSLSSMVPSKIALSIPENYEVQLIPSGCCGMAGSFGYEKEHYDVSMKIGELVLFPTIRKMEKEEIIAASGTSCRHQIADGTGKKALHPAEILFYALKD